MGSLSLDTDGAEVWQGALKPNEVARLLAEVARHHARPGRGGLRGANHLLPTAKAISNSADMHARLSPFFKRRPRLVRSILFDKSAKRNWLVTWHQDRTIAVSDRFDQDGWRNWSMKGGFLHAEPPRTVLERMITVRLHLDDTDEARGCLSIIPGSHRTGVLDRAEIEATLRKQAPLALPLRAGDALMMRPLVLHASGKMSEGQHRRILHLEFSDLELPAGIVWAG